MVYRTIVVCEIYIFDSRSKIRNILLRFLLIVLLIIKIGWVNSFCICYNPICKYSQRNTLPINRRRKSLYNKF